MFSRPECRLHPRFSRSQLGERSRPPVINVKAVTRVRKPPPQERVSKPKFRIVVIFPRRIFFSPIDSLRAVSQSLPAFAPFTRGGSGSYDQNIHSRKMQMISWQIVFHALHPAKRSQAQSEVNGFCLFRRTWEGFSARAKPYECSIIQSARLHADLR